GPQTGSNSPGNPQSNVLTLQGSIQANNTGPTLDFVGGNITAVEWDQLAPNTDGTGHTPFAPGAVGLRGTTTVLLFVSVLLQAALRDLELGIDGSAPLAGTDFDLSALTLGIDQATLGYYVSSSALNQGGSTTVTNESAP